MKIGIFPLYKEIIVYYLDIFGTLAFAISGAFRAVKYELDLLGVIVLAIFTGVGGGIIRDTLLGQTPPTALTDQVYIITCTVGALIVFWLAPKIAKRWDIVMSADALGLSLFTAMGAAKADALGANSLTIILMAMITSSGGGVIRDLFVREIPAVLKSDFYATAALLGGGVYVICDRSGLSESATVFITIVITLLIRTAAMNLKFSLPRVKSLEASPSQLTKLHKEKIKK